MQSQLICHLIIRELSNCALFAKSFHIHCNWLIIHHLCIFKWSVVRHLTDSSQVICHLIICEFSRCVFFAKSFHTHLIIRELSNYALFAKSFHIHCNWLIIKSFVNFQIVRCSPNFSTIIAIDSSSNQSEFSNCRLFAKSFHNQCNWLIFQSFVNFQTVCCSSNLSTFKANNSSSDHLCIFKLGVVRQIFPNSSWGRSKAHFVKRI